MEWNFSITSGIVGCTSNTALNYNPEANVDDSSCIEPCPDSTHLPFVFVMGNIYGNGDQAWTGYDIWVNGQPFLSGTWDAQDITELGGPAGGPIEAQDSICLPAEGCMHIVPIGYYSQGDNFYAIEDPLTGSVLLQSDFVEADVVFGTIDCACQDFNPEYLDTDGDGVCDFAEVEGCMDEAACNFNPVATDDVGCNYGPVPGYDCFGNCLSDTDGDGICDGSETDGNNQGQSIAFHADTWPEEVTDIWVIHEGDTLYAFSTDVIANELFSGPNSSSAPFNLFYTGAFQVVALDSFGDGGMTFSVDPGAGNSCYGDCSPVYRSGSIMEWNFSITSGIAGCMDSTACNFNAAATDDDGSCSYAGTGQDCEGNCLSDADGDGICDFEDTVGCMDSLALNFNPYAVSTASGQCNYAVSFLLDAQAAGLGAGQSAWITGSMGDFGGADIQMTQDPEVQSLWSAEVILADGTYTYVYTSGSYQLWESNLEGTACDANESPTISYRSIVVPDVLSVSECWNCTCDLLVPGCDDALACNYDPEVNLADGSCIYPATPGYDCEGNCLDVNGDGECDYGLQLVWELIHEDIGFLEVDAQGNAFDLSGYSTYRLYVESTGQLMPYAFGSLDGTAMHFSCSGDVFNSELNFNYASEINPLLIPLIPSIGYDSWWTLGIEGEPNSSIGECDPAVVVDNTDNSGFLTEANWSSSGNPVGGPFMYVVSSCTNQIPDENNRVLIGQFTTNGALGVECQVVGMNGEVQEQVLLTAFTGTITGCTDPLGCNYLPLVSSEVQCFYPDALGICGGNCLADENANGLCDADENQGCTSSTACNYSASATLDDGSCVFPSPFAPCGTYPGCTEPTACNYDDVANEDDGSCILPTAGCEECLNGGVVLVDTDGDGVCDAQEVPGCTDATAVNYSEAATDDDGSCISEGVFFQVDMSNYPLQDGDVVNVTGSFDGWCGICNPMSDEDGDQVYSLLLELVPGEYEYKFVINDWEVQEGWDDPGSLSVGAPCDYNPDDEFPNRGFNYQGGVVILDVVCFSSCTACGATTGCADPEAMNYDAQAEADDGSCVYELTLLLDASQAGLPDATAIYAPGGWNGWNTDPTTAMAGPDAASLVLNLTVPAGTFEYKFTTFGFEEYEWSAVTNAGGQVDLPCVTTDGFNSRTVTVPDELVVDVCWESCDPCEPETGGCTDASACNYDAAAALDDGSCSYAGTGLDCEGNCLADADGDGICDGNEVAGCTDSVACNFNGIATDDDGTCEYSSCNCDVDENGQVWVVFQVNMSDAGLQDGDVVYVSGGFDGWCGSCYPMTDPDGDGVYTIDLPITPGVVPFKYVVNGWGGEELLPAGGCDDTQDDGFDNRELILGTCPVVLDPVCFGSCDVCPPNPPGCTNPEAINYEAQADLDDGSCLFALTLMLDASQAGLPDATTVYAPGGWNGWSTEPATAMAGPDAANLELTLIVGSGTFEYKFATDGFEVYEWSEVTNAGGQVDLPCVTTDGINNRQVTVPEQLVVDVCWESCDPCGPAIVGCTDPVACNYDGAANLDDGSCSYAGTGLDCEGNCLNDSDGDGVCDEYENAGCMDPAYVEYDAESTMDDGSCSQLADPGCVSSTMDGYAYEVVQIGTQCWFAENLRTTTYRDESLISAPVSSSGWAADISGAQTVYGAGLANCENINTEIDACDEVYSLAQFGRLYNWYAVINEKGVCPSGWHVASVEDWNDLQAFVSENGGGSAVGTALKSDSLWTPTGGIDSYGFTGMPGGFRSEFGGFIGNGNLGYWWSSTPHTSTHSWMRYLWGNDEDLYHGNAPLSTGASIRCVLDVQSVGCTFEDSFNYNPQATIDDGSCDTLLQCAAGEVLTTLNMFDDWGDGWNGNTYTLTLNGNVVATGTLDSSITVVGGQANGALQGADTLCLATGCYEVQVGGGAFVTETSWTISEVESGYEIASGADGILESFYFGETSETCGCIDDSSPNFNADATVDDGSCLVCSSGQPVRFEMTDSFGDGWGGGAYFFLDGSGSIVATGGLLNGAEGQDVFCLDPAECYTLFFEGGNFPGEWGWSLYLLNEESALQQGGVGEFQISLACGCYTPEYYAPSSDPGCANAMFVYHGDDYPTEFSWELISETGEPLFSKNYGGEAIDTLYFDLPEACFNLVVSDAYGDGICCDVGEGFYELWYLDVLMAEGGDFEFSETTSFCTTADGCPDPMACNYSVLADIQGVISTENCLYPDENACEVCLNGAAEFLGVDDQGECLSACSNALALNYNPSFAGPAQGCEFASTNLMISGMIKHPHTSPEQGGDVYLHLTVLDTIPDLSEYKIFSESSGGSAFGGALIPTMNPVALPSGSYLPGDELILIKAMSSNVQFVAAQIEAFYAECWGENVHVIQWSDPDNLAGNYHLVGTGADWLSSVLLFRDQNVADMFGDFFIDSNGDWRVIQFMYQGVGGLGFTQGYVQRTMAEPSAIFEVSDWSLPDCVCLGSPCSYNSEALDVTELDCYYPLCSNYGCTDPTACNYVDGAGYDDGSCLTYDQCGECGGNGLGCVGCMDELACNFDPEAIIDNGNCAFLDAVGDCGGDCLLDNDGDGICDLQSILGCTNPLACNFDPSATVDDGSCLDPALYDPATCQCYNDLNFNDICDELETQGCTNPGACNFDSGAEIDDDSCVFPLEGYDCEGNCQLLDADLNCLDAAGYDCERNSVVAAEGNVYIGAPEDIPTFYAIGESNDLQFWGAIPLDIWESNHPLLTSVSGNLGAIFSGAWGRTILVSQEGTIMNPGEVNYYGVYLPPLQNVVEVDNGEFQALVLQSDGNVQGFSFDEPTADFSIPIDVVLADVIDIACTMENNVAVDSEGNIHVWGQSYTIGELGYGMPSDMVGNWIAVDGSWSELVGITDAGDAAVWPYDASLNDNWKTQFNNHDWLADPAVDARIAQNWACVLTESGELVHFSADSSIWMDGSTYSDLMPPPSFGPVVDFDISMSGLVAKNANGQVHSAYMPVYSQQDPGLTSGIMVSNNVPADQFAYPLCIPGCIDPVASNFFPAATEDDGSCIIPGCTNPSACNFDPIATVDDGSCEVPEIYGCDGVTCLNDVNGNGICDELEDPGCRVATACNFDPQAVIGTVDLCNFPEPWKDCDGNCLLDLNGDGQCDRMTDYLCGVGEIVQVDPFQANSLKTARILVEGGYYSLSDDISTLQFTQTSEELQGLMGTPALNTASQWVIGIRRDSSMVDLALDPDWVLDAQSSFGFIPTPLDQKVAMVEPGSGYFIAIKDDGGLMGWGMQEPEFAPTLTPSFSGATAIDVDDYAVAAVNSNSGTYWGSYFQQSLLDVPAYVLNAIEDIAELELTYQNGFALMTNGTLNTWGTYNDGYTLVPGNLDSIIHMSSSNNLSSGPLTIGLLDAEGHIGVMEMGAPILDTTIFSNIIAMSPGMIGPLGVRFLALRGDGLLVQADLNPYTDELQMESVQLVSFEPVLCIPGCTDTLATNFQPLATSDDGGCLYEGCTDPTAFNYDPEAVDDDGSCITSGCTDPSACNFDAEAAYGLRLETVTVHDGLVGTSDLAGFTTYRLYVDLPDSADFVSAVYGNDEDTLRLQTTGSFYQNILGGVTPNAVNPILFSAFPDLAYDSWVTIGNDQAPLPGEQAISVVEDVQSPWILPFESGNGFEINTTTGGSWYIVNNGTALNGVAGEDRSVLLGQFTTDGSLYGQLQIQFFPLGEGSNFQVLTMPISGACSYADPYYDCDGTCLNDLDGDGVCDELEVPGCTNPSACNFDEQATDEDGTCRISSGEVQVSLEAWEIHDGMVGTDDLSGYTTYRLYAQMDQPEDQLMAVFGDLDNEMVIRSTSMFWHHPLGSVTGDGIQSGLLSTFPAMEYDSYVTIGSTQFQLGNGLVELAESSDPSEQWLPSFIAGGDIEINSVTGGGWYVIPAASPYPNTLPDDSGRVLLGQFTTTGIMYGQLNVQLEACGVGTLQVTDLDFGASPELIGCTDSTACNYSDLAVENDGSCCFEHCLELYSPESNVIHRETGEEVAWIERYDGTREFCLPEGCYQIEVQPGDSILWEGQNFHVEEDSILLTAGALLCDGCLNERACNYAPDAIFDNGECSILLADLDVPPNFNVGISDLLFLLSEYGCSVDCSSDLNGDDQVGAQDLLIMLGTFGDDCGAAFSGCMDPAACNFSPLNVQDDGSCQFPDPDGNCN